MASAQSIQHFLADGVAGQVTLSERLRAHCREVARAEIENMATLMESEPMGLQVGLLSGPRPTGSFELLRARDRATLAINPFLPDSHPSSQTGVALITAADEAIAAHQRVAELSWREATKGPAAAAKVRAMLKERPA